MTLTGTAIDLDGAHVSCSQSQKRRETDQARNMTMPLGAPAVSRLT